AVAALGRTSSEAALRLCLDLLEDPELAPSACAGLRTALENHDRSRTAARLWTIAEPRLRTALRSAQVPTPVRDEIAQAFPCLLRVATPIDFREAEKLLLNADDPVYQGQQADHGACPMLHALREASDPRAASLLAKVVRTLPRDLTRAAGP